MPNQRLLCFHKRSNEGAGCNGSEMIYVLGQWLTARSQHSSPKHSGSTIPNVFTTGIFLLDRYLVIISMMCSLNNHHWENAMGEVM